MGSAAPIALENGGASRHYFLAVTNDGTGAAGFGSDAVDVVLRFTHPCLRGDVPSGGFAASRPFSGAPDAPSSAARADGVRFAALHLAPGQTLMSGPIPVAAGGAVATVAWRATGDGGFTTTSGKIDLTPAAAKLPENP